MRKKKFKNNIENYFVFDIFIEANRYKIFFFMVKVKPNFSINRDEYLSIYNALQTIKNFTCCLKTKVSK